jgi:hypothetical protein
MGREITKLGLSGYWFRVPTEVEELMRMGNAELRTYLVVQHALQRDRSGGRLSISQIAGRSGLSKQHVCRSVNWLCKAGFLTAEKERGKTTIYRSLTAWKKGQDHSPTGERLCDRDRGQGERNYSPTGERYHAPTGNIHSEYSEFSECESASSTERTVDNVEADCEAPAWTLNSHKRKEEKPQSRNPLKPPLVDCQLCRDNGVRLVNGKVERCSCDFGVSMPDDLLARMAAAGENGRGQRINAVPLSGSLPAEAPTPETKPSGDRRVIESVACPKCGGSVTVWSDGAVEDCQCRGKRDRQKLRPAAKTQPVSALQGAQGTHEVTDRALNERK